MCSGSGYTEPTRGSLPQTNSVLGKAKMIHGDDTRGDQLTELGRVGSDSQVPHLVECIALALMGAINEQDTASPAKLRAPDIFDSSEVPGISVERYLRRLQAVFKCGEASFIGALVILDRYLAGGPVDQEPRRLTALNVHRLFLACLVVTVKYNEDLIYGNSHYARAGGIHVREVNRLERHLLLVLDYDLRVQPDQYSQYEQVLLFMRPGEAPKMGLPLSPVVIRCGSIKEPPAATKSACWQGGNVVAAHLQVHLVLQQ